MCSRGVVAVRACDARDNLIKPDLLELTFEHGL